MSSDGEEKFNVKHKLIGDEQDVKFSMQSIKRSNKDHDNDVLSTDSKTVSLKRIQNNADHNKIAKLIRQYSQQTQQNGRCYRIFNRMLYIVGILFIVFIAIYIYNDHHVAAEQITTAVKSDSLLLNEKNNLEIDFDPEITSRDAGNGKKVVHDYNFTYHKKSEENPNLAIEWDRCKKNITKHFQGVLVSIKKNDPKWPQRANIDTVGGTILGAPGKSAIIISDNQDPFRVKKIGKEFGVFGGFKNEYCLNTEIKSPYIGKVFAGTFNPYEVNTTKHNAQYNEQEYESYKFGATEKFHGRDFVPSFDLEKCSEVPWKQLTIDFNGTERQILYDMTYALNHIHQSGIELIDINDGNVMLCGTQLKYIDIEFAEILNKDASYKPERFPPYDRSRGTLLYKPPWLLAFDFLPRSTEGVQSERITRDIWGVGILFMTEMCKIKGDITTMKRRYSRRSSGLLKALDTIAKMKLRKGAIQEKLDKLFKQYAGHIETLLNQSDNCKDILFLKQLLEINPEKRLENFEKVMLELSELDLLNKHFKQEIKKDN